MSKFVVFGKFGIFSFFLITLSIGGEIMEILTNNQMQRIIAGEPFSVAAVMACLVTAIIAVICYRLFMSKSGSTTIPGGFKFTWS